MSQLEIVREHLLLAKQQLDKGQLDVHQIAELVVL